MCRASLSASALAGLVSILISEVIKAGTLLGGVPRFWLQILCPVLSAWIALEKVIAHMLLLWNMKFEAEGPCM